MKNRLSFACAVSLVLAIVGCKRHTPKDLKDYETMYGIKPSAQIHFIIPNGFRGEIRITNDRTNGAELQTRGGEIVINVPQNGQIALRDWAPLFREHREMATYEDGTPLVNPDAVPVGHKLALDAVAFWCIGTARGTTYPQETLRYFVGTEQDRNAWPPPSSS